MKFRFAIALKASAKSRNVSHVTWNIIISYHVLNYHKTSRRTPFRHYFHYTVRGAVINHLRNKTPALVRKNEQKQRKKCSVC